MAPLTVRVTPEAVTVGNGTTLYSETVSPADEQAVTPTQTVVLIHGMGGTVNIFHPIYASLLEKLPSATLIAYDWSDTGLSPRDGPPPTVQDHANDLAALILTKAPTGPIQLVAHSAGTFLALELLLSSSPVVSRVTHAIMMSGPNPVPFVPQVVAMQQSIAEMIAQNGASSVVEMIYPMLVGETTLKDRPAASALIRSICMMQSPAGYAATIRAFSEYGLNKNAIPFAEIPSGVKVLFVGGAEDKMVPREDLEKVARETKGSTVAILPNVGHSPTVEDPLLSAQTISSFLGGSA